MRILLVEDDAAAAEGLELILRKARLTCDLSDSGEEAIELATLYDYDLILLDLTLPDLDGYEVLRNLRLGKVETPVLILTGREGTEAMLRGFGLGADDYLTKPFDREELLARIHAIVRRSMGHPEAVIRTGAIAVNLDAKMLEVEGRPVRLTGKEYEMLELLRSGRGRQSPRRCSSTTSMAPWTGRRLRSSRSSSAS